MRIPIAEIPTPYSERPKGSDSKLRTVSDGMRIMRTITHLLKEERPLAFFGTVSTVLVVVALGIGIPVVVEFIKTGLVPRFPTAILATGLMILASLSLVCGLILETVTRGRIEMKRLSYLSVPIRFRPRPTNS
jgi:hypothetical protein